MAAFALDKHHPNGGVRIPRAKWKDIKA